MMRIDMSRGPDHAGIPTTMFEGRFEGGTVTLANYDVLGPDGFLMVQPDAVPPPSTLLVTLGCFTELT